jgi:hypothetical protein
MNSRRLIGFALGPTKTIYHVIENVTTMCVAAMAGLTSATGTLQARIALACWRAGYNDARSLRPNVTS